MYRLFKKEKSLNFTDIVEEDGDIIDIENTNEEYIPDKAVNEQALREFISEELNKLPDDQRTCIMLRYFEDLSIAEVATTIGCSESTVKSRINYGQKKLASSIDEYQKKNDIKLYNISAIPLLLYFMRRGAENVIVDKSNMEKVMKFIPTEVVKEASKKGLFGNFFEKTTNKVVAGVAAASIAVASPIVYQAVKKADPFDYIVIEFSGLDGNGNANYEINEQKILDEYVGKEPTNFEELAEYLKEADSLLSNIDVEISKSENLENGEKILVTVTTEGEVAKKIKSEEKQFTVSGLTECEKVDVFKDLDVQFTGISGLGKVYITNNSKDPFNNVLNFTTEKIYNLSNSEKIVIEVSCSESDAIKYGKQPLELSKEYVVSGLDEYMTLNKITNDVVQNIASYQLNQIQEENEKDKYFIYKNLQFHSAFFQDRVEKSIFGRNNLLTVILSEEMYENDGDFLRVNYFPIVLNDIVNDEQGNPIVYVEGGTKYFITNVEGYIDDLLNDTQYKTSRIK